MQHENYQHYADLFKNGKRPMIPDGAILRAVDADRMAWRVISNRGVDCFFKTLRETQDYCNQHGYSILNPGKKGK